MEAFEFKLGVIELTEEISGDITEEIEFLAAETLELIVGLFRVAVLFSTLRLDIFDEIFAVFALTKLDKDDVLPEDFTELMESENFDLIELSCVVTEKFSELFSDETKGLAELKEAETDDLTELIGYDIEPLLIFEAAVLELVIVSLAYSELMTLLT